MEPLNISAVHPQMVKLNDYLLEVVQEKFRYALVTKLGHAAAVNSP